MTINAVNMAITTCDQDERRRIAENYDVMPQVLDVWNGGKICGQCCHFRELGGHGYGLNGTCRVVQKNCYTKPSDLACAQFVRICENG